MFAMPRGAVSTSPVTTTNTTITICHRNRLHLVPFHLAALEDAQPWHLLPKKSARMAPSWLSHAPFLWRCSGTVSAARLRQQPLRESRGLLQPRNYSEPVLLRFRCSLLHPAEEILKYFPAEISPPQRDLPQKSEDFPPQSEVECLSCRRRCLQYLRRTLLIPNLELISLSL